MNCPHCHKPISSKLIKAEAGRAAQSKRVYQVKARPCEFCGALFGARELRTHRGPCRRAHRTPKPKPSKPQAGRPT
jgi:hypothetical protein